MSVRRILFLILGLCLALALAAQAQDGAGVSLREQDESLTTVEERQRAVAILLTRAGELRLSGQPLEAARSLNRAGALQIRLYLRQDALATFQEALRLLQQTPDVETQIDSLNGIGRAYRGLSKCDLAQPAFDQAITLSKQTDFKAGQAKALLNLSHCQNYGDHALALRSAREALHLWTSLGHKRGTAEAHILIGSYEMTQSNLAESSKSFETALTLWRELSDTDQQADVLINLGFIECRKGAWQDSLAFFTQAQHLVDEKAEPYKMGQIAAGLAEAFIESGLPEIGLDKSRESLEYYRLTNNPRAMIAMGWGIGKAQYLSRDYAEALTTLQTARTQAEAINESTLTALCDDFLGRTYYALNDMSLALSHFQAALDGYLRAKNQMEAARTRALMGQVYQRQQGFTKARRSYQDALTIFRKLSDRINESATLHALGKLELTEGHLDLAEEYLRSSIEATENIRRISTSNDLTAAFSAAVYDRYQTYIECLMQKHKAQPDQGFEVRAFEISEQARGRSLLELLRATGTNFTPGVDSTLVAEEKSLRQSLRVKEDYRVALLGRDYQREELATLETELARLDNEYKQVVHLIQARYPAYREITNPEHYGSLQIQKQVIADDQMVLLEYSLGPERSYVWAVTRDRVTSYELPSQAVIEEKANTLYRTLVAQPDSNNGDDLSLAAQELGQLVLEPIAAELNRRTVIIVADGALHYVPFQLLPKSSTDSEPLVASSEVVNAPSASILAGLHQGGRERPRGKLLAAFGAPVFESKDTLKGTDGNVNLAALQNPENRRWHQALRDIQLNGDSFDPSVLKPLIFASRELANLREVTSGDEAFVAADFDATRDSLFSTDLTQYSILHFATHGLLDPRRPENSGLVLSTITRDGKPQNGFVSLQDIYQLRAPVDLVVLSACQTGLGKDVRGEGLIGLTRGFMYAGASSVVASLWKVDDEATAELMKRFYIHMLQDGMTPAAALRAAQNSIRQQPQWRSPYYWAAFTLQGEFKQVIKPAQVRWMPGRWQIVLGLSLLLFLAAAGWYRWSRVARA